MFCLGSLFKLGGTEGTRSMKPGAEANQWKNHTHTNWDCLAHTHAHAHTLQKIMQIHTNALREDIKNKCFV